MADKGKDVSRFFTNSGEMRKPIQRVNVDFTASILEELESAARDLNISRQAVIHTTNDQPGRKCAVSVNDKPTITLAPVGWTSQNLY